METKVGWLNGIVVVTKEGVIRFDPSSKKTQEYTYTFISHAHSDHIRGLNSRCYLTAETKDIISSKNCKEEIQKVSTLKYGDELTIGELEISVHNSGHILGSAQYVIRDKNLTIVYTGDINFRKMMTTTAAEIVPCDILILETTYGNPFYVFPTLTETYVNVINWAISEIQKDRIPTFVVYSVGKAQEIIKIFNNFTNIPVRVSHTIAKINEAYIKNGVNLKYLDIAFEEQEGIEPKFIQVISTFEKPILLNRCSFASASGWALKHHNSNKKYFPLSCHADFDELIDYVKCVKPKEIFTIHGFKADFSRYVSKKLGIRAQPIPIIDQKDLRIFM